MPTVLRYKGYRFFFFSNEGFEPPHIHIEKDNSYAKVWLEAISVAKNYGFSAKEMNFLLSIVEKNRKLFEERWNEYFDR